MPAPFHPDFRERPFWWDAWEPRETDPREVPASTRVAIVGAGYAGLAAALELHTHGIETTVFDADLPGNGASTRSGGLVSGAAGVRNPLLGPPHAPDLTRSMMKEMGAALALLERLISTESIDCGWTRSGYFAAAWSPRQLAAMRTRAEWLNEAADAGASVVERAAQREHIGSDFYHGGLLVRAAGHLHPSLYFGGLLAACERRGIRICAQAGIERLARDGSGWKLTSTRGTTRAGDVLIATNGYTGDATPALRRRLVPLRPYVIATEPLEPALALSVSPANHALVESKRIAAFYRLWTADNRLVWGSRQKWLDIEPRDMAPLLHASMVERFPQLADTRITHAWTGNVALTLDERPHVGELDGMHYALGCNGNGVAPMTWLGTLAARRLAKVAGADSVYDGPDFPDHRLYNGRSRWFIPLIGNWLGFRDWLDRGP